jgi:hypothetical protein
MITYRISVQGMYKFCDLNLWDPFFGHQLPFSVINFSAIDDADENHGDPTARWRMHDNGTQDSRDPLDLF